MKRFFGLVAALALIQNIALADPTKPTPEPGVDAILNSLDCAGTIDGTSVRLKPGPTSQNQDEFVIEVVTTLPSFTKYFVVVGSYTSRTQYVVHGNDPEAFMFLIDKTGVHGAHNAALEFPMSPGQRYEFECYFY